RGRVCTWPEPAKAVDPGGRYLYASSLQDSTSVNVAPGGLVFAITISPSDLCHCSIGLVVSYIRSNELPTGGLSAGILVLAGTKTKPFTSCFWFPGTVPLPGWLTPMACANLGSATMKRRI